MFPHIPLKGKYSIIAMQQKIDKVENEMQQLVMDAVNSFMVKRDVLHIDYGVEAASTPPLVRTARAVPIKTAEEESVTNVKDAPVQAANVLILRSVYGDVPISTDTSADCSCSNGVMKLCNSEIKFNTTRAGKAEESSYCLTNASTVSGVMTKKERIVCKQSDVRDGCTLSLLVGREVNMKDVKLVTLFKDKATVDNNSLKYRYKLIQDICDFADEDRPHTLKPVSKYRPIFVSCNVTTNIKPDARNTNKVHYLVSITIFVVTFVSETIYQSWLVGLEIFIAGNFVGFAVALEDALLSARMEVRNYALTVVLLGAVFTFITGRGMAVFVWVIMLAWLCSVEAIDGITFEENGNEANNKIIYVTSLNMHVNDLIVMGNASMKLINIRQRREYDYAQTLPRLVTCNTLCKNWDCTNEAPNCYNKCENVESAL